jgi:glutamine synthetase
MANDWERVLTAIKTHDAKFVDLRFTDTRGKEHHITVPAATIDKNFLENGKLFDGSSIEGWQKIHESDLSLIPDTSSLLHDPFYQDSTLIVRCNVVDPITMLSYDRDPRSLALRAEAYLQSTGIADEFLIGPKPEFFLFNSVRWDERINSAFYEIDSDEGQWNSGKSFEGGNIGHRPGIKGGYFPIPPVDSSQDIRSAICLTLQSLGIVVKAHHHEVATGNQCEVVTGFDTLTRKADQLQLLKYVVQNVAHNYGKTATFMPKPLVGDNGSGMHCHQSLTKGGVNLFKGDGYAGLSELALYYIGGIIKHARTLNAFTNPATNSYKRLVSGFKAPVLLAYSASNRSASIRIPHVSNANARRIEVRFPDCMANPYLAFTAMMMAGLDGIQKKIHPGQPIDKDLYNLPLEALTDIPTVCDSLDKALAHLSHDHDFLLQGDVFSRDFIESYVALGQGDVMRVRQQLSAVEFALYYSL